MNIGFSGQAAISLIFGEQKNAPLYCGKYIKVAIVLFFCENKDECGFGSLRYEVRGSSKEKDMRNKLPSISTIAKAMLLLIFAAVIYKEIVIYHFPEFWGVSYVTGEKYISFAYLMQFLLELLFENLVILLAGLALFGKKPASAFDFTDVAFALSVSLPLLFLFNPIDKKRVAVSSFSRVIGMGLIGDWDVKSVISNFMIYFCLFAIIFWSALVCSNRYLRGISDGDRAEGRVYKAALAVNAGWMGYYIFAYFIYSATSNLYNIGTVLLLLLIGFILLYHILRPDISFMSFFLFLVSSLGMSYGFCAMFISELEGGRAIAGVWFIVVLLATLLLKWKAALLREILYKNINLKIILGFMAAVPLLLSFYIEAVNVLNQWGIFVAHPRRGYSIAMLLLTVLLLVSAFWLRKRAIGEKLSEWIYIVLILGFSCISVQLNLENLVYADIFETANSGVLISDFLRFGKIPVVEHYGGHMLSSVIGGILYGIVNQDYSGAAYTMYYLAAPIVAFLFYKFMQAHTSRETALLTTLFFPYDLLWSYFGMAAAAVLLLVYYLKGPNWKRALVLWGTVAGLCLYRLDLGAAALESSVIVLVLYAVVRKNKKIIRDNLLGGGAVAVFYLVLWTALCLWKGISPIDRAMEFIGISASNYTWAYSSIGDTSLTAFGWFYLCLPFLAIATGLLLLLHKKIRGLFDEIEVVMFINLIGIYFFNYSRGLVRHSVVELGTTATAQMTALIYIVLAVLSARILQNKDLCVPFMAGFIVLNSLFIGGKAYVSMPQLYQATGKLEPIVEGWTLSRFDRESEKLFGVEVNTYWEEISIKQTVMDRTVMYDNNRSEVYELKEAMDTLLGEEETFLDFVSKSFIYAAYGREDPVYLSQTPSMLSNEFTQQQYIKEVQAQYDRIPIVIMPSLTKGSWGYDGVRNSVRYYKVVEYLYQNYRPLCVVNGYCLWCANNRYEDLSAKARGLYEAIDWGYSEVNHTYDLQKLPHIWAEYDGKKAAENPETAAVSLAGENEYWIENVADIDKSSGNYLMLTIASNMDQTVRLCAGNQDNPELSVFTFDVYGGEYKYLIRISSDYYWYNNRLDRFTLSAGGENGIVFAVISVLAGD